MRTGNSIFIDSLQKLIDKEVRSSQLITGKTPTEVLLTGGKGFVQRCKMYGVNEKSQPLRFYPWFEELLEIIGDYRIKHTLTTGCSQLCKTLSNTLLLVDTLVVYRLNIGWFYATRDAMFLNIREQFLPIAQEYANRFSRANRVSIQRDDDRKLSNRYQINGATAMFSFCSTSSRTSPQREGLASVGGAAASSQMNALFIEERSQSQPASIAVLPRRLDASSIPTKPIRELGTPGRGLGIEHEIQTADYHFYPHISCDDCGSTVALDARGCVLQLYYDYLGKERYLDTNGRPKHYHDDIRCPVCGAIIPREKRINAWMQCLNTGVTARDFLDSLPHTIEEVLDLRLKVGVHISPLLRDSPNAEIHHTIIETGVNSPNVDDFSQQLLGWKPETNELSISQEMLASAHGVSPPDGAYIRVAGVDQGNQEDWLVICDFYLPDVKYLTQVETYTKSVRHIIYASDIARVDIPDILNDYNVLTGFMDIEPGVSAAQHVADRTVLNLCDQKNSSNFIIKEASIKSGREQFDCFQIENSYFKNTILDTFRTKGYDDKIALRIHPIIDLGGNTYKSFARHFKAPVKNPETWKWLRPSDHVDDLFMCQQFCEAAFYHYLGDMSATVDWYSNI